MKKFTEPELTITYFFEDVILNGSPLESIGGQSSGETGTGGIVGQDYAG